MAPTHTTEIATGLPGSSAEPSSELIAEISATLLRGQTFLSGCGVALMVREGVWLVCRASSGAPAPEIGTRMEVDHSFLGLCLTSKKSLSCDNADSDLRVENVTYSRLRPKAILAVPVRAGQRVLAVLAGFSAAPNAFSHTQVALLRTMADSLSRPVQQLFTSLTAAGAPNTPQPLPSSPREQLRKKAAKPEPQPRRPPAPVLPARKRHLQVLALADEPSPRTIRMLEPLPTPSTRIVNLPVPRSFETPQPGLWARRRFRPALLSILGIMAICLLFAIATTGWIPDAPGIYTAPILPPPIQTTQVEPVIAHVSEIAEAPASSAAVEPKVLAGVSAPAEPPPAETHKPKFAAREVVAPKVPEAAPAKPPTLALSAAPTLPALVVPHAVAPKIHHSQATEAQLEKRVAPQYPRAALSRRIAGQVMLSVQIRKDGSVGDVRLLSGNPLFHMSALEAVKQWRYSPATLDGTPVEAHAQVTVKFDLPGNRR